MRGESRRRRVREDGLCDVHGGRIDVREAGRRGGQAKPKTDREQANVLAGFELDADGVPVDLERWEDWRLYELSAQDKNQAAAIAALKERLARRQTDPSRTVSVDTARAELVRRLEQIEDHRRRHAGVCPTCGGLLPASEAPRRGPGPGIEGG